MVDESNKNSQCLLSLTLPAVAVNSGCAKDVRLVSLTDYI